jgi:hypothetical protein
MNEKLYDVLDRVQSTAVRAGGAAADAACGVGRRAGALLSTAKLNIRVTELRGQVNTALQEAGAMLYATHTGTPTDSNILLAKLEEIDALYAQIDALNAQIGREEAAHTCATCGARTQDGDQFCRECGGKL